MKRFILLIMLPIALTSCQAGPAPTPTPTSIPKPTEVPAPTAGQTRLDAKGIEQVWVPAGSFRMGTDEPAITALKALNPPGFVLGEFQSEQPAHEVQITHGYWIDKYEVTHKDFQAFAKDGGYTNRELWSEAGWAWLSKQYLDQLPRFCLGNQPDHPAACITWY